MQCHHCRNSTSNLNDGVLKRTTYGIGSQKPFTEYTNYYAFGDAPQKNDRENYIKGSNNKIKKIKTDVSSLIIYFG